MATTTTRITIIISEGRDTDSKRPAIARDLTAALSRRSDLQVVVVPHLYDLDADGPGMRRLRRVPGDMIVLAWLYPRAAYWILNAGGVTGHMADASSVSNGQVAPVAGSQSDKHADRAIWCLDLREHGEVGPILAEVERIAGISIGRPTAPTDRADQPSTTAGEHGVEEATQPRWYPVVDYERCNHCLECLNFCLFGVFSVDTSGGLIVEQPDACRDGCPACARVCPAQAIMFPDHNTPAIAGDPNATSGDFNTEFVQLFDALSPTDLAAAERDRALAERAEQDQPARKDELDRLVDDLDEMEL